MIFQKKQQTRIWCISLLYKYYILKLPLLKPSKSNLNLAEFFNDECIFDKYEGDIDCFWDLYSAIYANQVDLDINLRMMIDIKLIDLSFKSFAICCLAERIYLKVDTVVIVSEYIKLLRMYNEVDVYKIISKIGQKNIE